MTKDEVVSELLKCLIKTPYDDSIKGSLTSVPRDTMNKALIVLTCNCIASRAYLNRLIKDVKHGVGDGGAMVIMRQQLLTDIAYWLQQERKQYDKSFLFSPNTKVAIDSSCILLVSDHDQAPIVIYNVNDNEFRRCVFLDYQIFAFTTETISNGFEIIVDDRIYQFEFTGEAKHDYIYKGCKKK